MGYVVKMPKLGMDMDQGTIVAWLVDEGDTVEEGQKVAEIESEKTTGDISVREDGVLRHRFLEVGDSVEPSGDVAIVAGADEDISDLLSGGAAESASDDADEAEAEDTSDSDGAAPQDASFDGPSATSSGGGAASASSVKATPRAKKRAEELGVDLAGVEGTGPQGAVSEDDVEAAAESGGGAASSESVKATPRAKKRAEELGVDLAGVEGTGPQGAVSEDDVEAAAAAAEEATEAESAGGAEVAEVGDERVFAPPRVRRLARELSVDLSTVEGSGPSGAVTEADVRAAAGIEEEPAEGEAEREIPGTHDEERPLTGMRRTIANRLGQSDREAVHVTVNRSADAEEMLDAASAANDALDEKISVNDVLLLALSASLDEHPAFNATFEEEVHRLHKTQDICTAIDIEEGLIAPVIRNVGELSLAELAAKRRAVTQKSLAGNYTMEDLTGGTFTVSNLGVLGVESFDPVINPPQVAILGVNTIKEEVVPVGDGDVGVRKRISFDLSFDHRIVDGADAARFMNTLVEHVENPWPLVIAAGGR